MIEQLKKIPLTPREKRERLYAYCASKKKGCVDCLLKGSQCINFFKPNFDIKEVEKMYRIVIDNDGFETV